MSTHKLGNVPILACVFSLNVECHITSLAGRDYKCTIPGMPTLQKICSIFRAEKGYFGWKTVFSPIVQYTCVVINLEKKTVFSQILQYFWGIFIKKQYKILQKSNTWHLCNTHTHTHTHTHIHTQTHCILQTISLNLSTLFNCSKLSLSNVLP